MSLHPICFSALRNATTERNYLQPDKFPVDSGNHFEVEGCRDAIHGVGAPDRSTTEPATDNCSISFCCDSERTVLMTVLH